MKIRTKLLLGILGALLFPLVAGVLSLRHLDREMTRTIGESTAASAELLVDQIQLRVYLLVASLGEFAQTNPEILAALAASNRDFERLGPEGVSDRLERADAAWRGWVAQPEGEPPAVLAEAAIHPLSAQLRRKLEAHRQGSEPSFAEIFVTNRFGANVALTSPTSDFRQDDEQWWQAGYREGVWLDDVDFDESSGVHSLDVVLRIDSQGEPAGMLKASLDIRHLHEILSDFESSAALAGGEAELRDPRGAVLYPTFAPPSAVARSADGAGPAADRRYWLEPGSAGSAGFLRAQATGAGHPELPDLRWTVRLRYPSGAVFAPIERVKKRLLTIGLIAALLALATAALVAHGISRPVGAALEAAGRIASGDVDVRLKVQGSGEVRDLLDAMDSMAKRLRSSAAGLTSSSARVGGLSTALSRAGGKITGGAERQAAAAERSAESVSAMNESIETVIAGALEVRREVAETGDAVAELTRSHRAVEQNVERLATGSAETLTTMQELARSIEAVAVTATVAGDVSETAVQQARAGGEAVLQTAKGVDEISSTMDEIALVNRSLAEKSERIDYITDVIEELARKTRLLALNATLQATHAGEHGRAFRAVAEEVKALAERSSGAAKEIGELVESVQGAIVEAESISQIGAVRAQEGVELAERAGRAFEGIVEAIEQVGDRIIEIRGATGEQAAGSEQLACTFESMSRMTEEAATALRQQSSTTEQILTATNHLREIAERVHQALGRQGADSRQVRESIDAIGEISAANLEAAGEVVAITRDLEGEARTLRALGEFFKLTPSTGTPEGDAQTGTAELPLETDDAEGPTILAAGGAAAG